MKKSAFSARFFLVVAAGVFSVVSCTVDKSGLLFDDEAYDKIVSGNGDGDGDTGGTGDGDGEGDTGGTGDGDGDLGGASSGGAGMGGGGPMYEAGDLRCDEKQIEFYVGNDLWVPLGAPCQYLCVDGACTGSCNPDDSECVSSSEVRVCDESGAWVNSACTFACVGDECGGQCVPGTKKCSGAQKQLCDETGAWVDDGAACPSACSEPEPGSAVCTGDCAPEGATQCVNNRAYQECEEMEWVDQGNCQFACVNDACGGSCVPGNSTCQGNAVVTCTPTGEPGTPSECRGQTCVSSSTTAKCDGECEPGQMRCAEGNVQECEQGQWVISVDCKALSEDYKVDLSCRPFGPPGEERYVCGECNPGDGSTDIRRCHSAKNHATNSEICQLDTKDVARWKSGKECDGYCYQGLCVNPEEACKADPQAHGCFNYTTRWFCDGEAPATKACKTGPFYCEHDVCEEMASSPVHEF